MYPASRLGVTYLQMEAVCRMVTPYELARTESLVAAAVQWMERIMHPDIASGITQHDLG